MSLYNNINIISGDGVFLEIENKGKCLDLTSGATVMNLGHGNKRIAQAIYNQSLSLSNTYVFNSPVKKSYSKRILEAFNHRGVENYDKIFFISSGSESIDSALRIAMVTTKRFKIISTPTSYHGRTIAGHKLSLLPFSKKVKGLNRDEVLFFKYPSKTLDSTKQSIEELELILNENHDTVCAIVLEPYQGDGGMIFPEKDFFIQVSKLCKVYNILMILDEIQSGFGRTGSMFAFQDLDIIPDIICIGKAISNGLPCSAVVLRKGINLNELDDTDFASSFGGNPLALAAADEVLNILNEDAVISKIKTNESFITNNFKILMEKYPVIKNISGRGMIYGIELSTTKENYIPIGNMFFEEAYNSSLIVMPPKGNLKNVIKISPPIIISIDELKIMFERLDNTLLSLSKRLTKE